MIFLLKTNVKQTNNINYANIRQSNNGFYYLINFCERKTESVKLKFELNLSIKIKI